MARGWLRCGCGRPVNTSTGIAPVNGCATAMTRSGWLRWHAMSQPAGRHEQLPTAPGTDPATPGRITFSPTATAAQHAVEPSAYRRQITLVVQLDLIRSVRFDPAERNLLSRSRCRYCTAGAIRSRSGRPGYRHVPGRCPHPGVDGACPVDTMVCGHLLTESGELRHEPRSRHLPHLRDSAGVGGRLLHRGQAFGHPLPNPVHHRSSSQCSRLVRPCRPM